MRTLTLLLDRDDLTCVEACCPEALSGYVLAFDTDIHLILEDQGVDHLTPWDIVGRDELPKLKAYEAAIWRHWTTHARLEFEGINLLGMAAYRHIAALARLTWAAYTVRRALEHLQPVNVYTFDEPTGHGLDQPVDYRKMPLLFGLLRGLAKRAGIPVQLLSRSPMADTAGFEDQIAKRSKRVYPPVDADAAIGGKPFVLFHGNRADLIRQVPLIHAIRRETDCQVVQLYKDADAEVVREVAQSEQMLWHESQVARVDPVADIAPFSKAARRRFDSASRAAPDELRVVFDNPYVASHFAFLFGEYARQMAGHVRAWKRFFARCRPVAFVANYHAPIYDVAAAVGIPCLGLPHGLVMIGQPRWFASLPDSSLIGAISERHHNKLVTFGVSRDRIRITGDPWSDQLLAEVRDRKSKAASAPNLRERLGIAPHHRIVLLCTGSFGMPSKIPHLPFIDWADGVRCMKELGEVARRHGEWTLLVKCHPRFDYPALYAGINRTLPADRQLLVPPQEPLGLLAEAADAICVWCTVTSALVEASLAGKPVMMFARNLIWYDPDDWGIEAWPHSRDVNDFEAELERLFSDPQHYAKRTRQAQQAARHYLGDTSDSATARCLRVLEEFMPSSVEAGSRQS